MSGREGVNGAPIPEEQLRDGLADCMRQIDALRHYVRQLEARLAQEVRTRRVVVVDGDGCERIRTDVTRTNASLSVLTPYDVDGPTASMWAALGESEDGQGRPVGHATVNVGAGGVTGVEMLADDIDGDRDPLKPLKVNGQLGVFRPDGEGPSVEVHHDGVKFPGPCVGAWGRLEV